MPEEIFRIVTKTIIQYISLGPFKTREEAQSVISPVAAFSQIGHFVDGWYIIWDMINTTTIEEPWPPPLEK